MTKRLRVLVVEDESSIRMHIVSVLEDAGYQVVTEIAQLSEALQAAVREEFDCAVLDVNLNGEFSYPVADILTGRDIPFIFLTAYSSPIVGFAHVRTIEKPFVESDFLAAVAAVTLRGTL